MCFYLSGDRFIGLGMAVAQMTDQPIAGLFEWCGELFEPFQSVQHRRSRKIVDIFDAHQPCDKGFAQLAQGEGCGLAIKGVEGSIHSSLAVEIVGEDAQTLGIAEFGLKASSVCGDRAS